MTDVADVADVADEPAEFNAPPRSSPPLPAPIVAALAATLEARSVSRRLLARAVSTTKTNIDGVVAGRSRPSVLTALRIGEALMLPPEFTDLMARHSSTVGRKMRYGDRHEGTPVVGVEPCPVDLATCHRLMLEALDALDSPVVGREFESRVGLYAIGLWPAMPVSHVVTGVSVDPWYEFALAHSTPLAVWHGDPAPPSPAPTVADLYEFIAAIPAPSVVRCTHHV